MRQANYLSLQQGLHRAGENHKKSNREQEFQRQAMLTFGPRDSFAITMVVAAKPATP